jgi:hypothetical protein
MVHIKVDEPLVIPPAEVFVLKTFVVKIFNSINPIKKESSPSSTIAKPQYNIIGDRKRSRLAIDEEEEECVSSSSSSSRASNAVMTPVKQTSKSKK